MRMTTSKMTDDSTILKSVKTKQYGKMQQTYQGRPFMTKTQAVMGASTPSISEKVKRLHGSVDKRSPDISNRDKELMEFESRF